MIDIQLPLVGNIDEGIEDNRGCPCDIHALQRDRRIVMSVDEIIIVSGLTCENNAEIFQCEPSVASLEEVPVESPKLEDSIACSNKWSDSCLGRCESFTSYIPVSNVYRDCL